MKIPLRSDVIAIDGLWVLAHLALRKRNKEEEENKEESRRNSRP
jgi:hypothetical protein